MNKFTKEQIEKAVKENLTFTSVCRALGVKPSGGSYYHMNKRIRKLNIDTSHFIKDKKILCRNINIRKKNTCDILVNTDIEYRLPRKILKRCMLEVNIEYKCQKCTNSGIWNNENLDLEIDHIDGNWKNNSPENLRFLCPNCHSQTKTFGSKNRN